MYSSLLKKILEGPEDFEFCEFECLDGQEKYECTMKLLEACERNKECVDRVMRFVGHVVPHLKSEMRFGCVQRVIRILHESEAVFGKDVYNVLDFSIVRSLQPLELISLANTLADYMNHPDNQSPGVSLWGLVRLIPYIHSVNQKEFAHEIYQLNRKAGLRQDALEGLTSLIYSMDQRGRSDMIFFFTDVIKGNEDGEAKQFALDLLKGVIGTLPESDRVMIADTVAPLLYYSDTALVKKAIAFFASVMSLIPQQDRFHFTQILAGLIHDGTLRRDVVDAIEKSLPFLAGENERAHFRGLLRQFGTGERTKPEESGLEGARYHKE